MVFSLFGRKEKAEARKAREAATARAGDSGTGTPDTDMQREIARRTAEKIDRIESEMIATGLPVPPAPKRVQGGSMADIPAVVHGAPNGVSPLTTPGLGMSTSIVIGDTANADDIHVSGSNLPPELEEAAILFANGQSPAAEATLKQAISSGSLGPVGQQAWLMLFDVYLATRQKDAFESMSLDYAARFEMSPPPWREDTTKPDAAGKPGSHGSSVLFSATVDSNLGKQIEQMKKAAASKKPAVLEFVSVQKIDNSACAVLLQAINAFKSGSHEMVLANPGKLFDAACANIEVGRRDEHQASWMLALEVLRAQGHKQKFDDMSIDYCVTYEVSPPSWEPMPAWVRTDSAPPNNAAVTAAKAAGGGEAGAFLLKGDIVGRMQTELAALRAYAHERGDLIIDCRELSRLDFVAAGELLNEVVTLRNMGKSIVFVEPNYLVLALMKVMGIHELADIRRRKA